MSYGEEEQVLWQDICRCLYGPPQSIISAAVAWLEEHARGYNSWVSYGEEEQVLWQDRYIGTWGGWLGRMRMQMGKRTFNF